MLMLLAFLFCTAYVWLYVRSGSLACSDLDDDSEHEYKMSLGESA